MRDRRPRAERWCPTNWCGADQLSVEPDPEQDELWHVWNAAGSRWTVAADEPVCPMCGTPLQVAVRHSVEVTDAEEIVLSGQVLNDIRRIAA